jgi:hypothetical protein
MESPFAAHPKHHNQGRRSICKKTHPQGIKSGKYEYLPTSKTAIQSGRWLFFTGDF